MNTIKTLLAICALSTTVCGMSTAFAEDGPASPVFFAHLLGGNEVTAGGAANVGDPNGLGTATVISKDTSTLCVAYLLNNIAAPTAAHIHKSVAGIPGPVVLALNKPRSGNPGGNSSCYRALDPALVADIIANPSGYYINIHNAEFPGGALRGQLF